MDESYLSRMLEMSEDWWRRSSTCEILLDLFSRHLLGLLIVATVNGETRATAYSGFLVYYQQQLFWFTAGHVLTEFKRVIAHPEIEIQGMRWLDSCEIEGAESIPVHNRDLDMFHMPEDVLDLGIVRITGLDRANLLRNERIYPLESQIWKNLHLGDPEGYYILG